jgi:predicted ATP-grasp superfamily ATP-dependent carboligase
MTAPSPRVPVLIFGSGLTVLGTMRLLHAAGTPFWVVGDGGDLAGRSRWFRTAPPSASGADPAKDLAGYLAGLPIDRAVLLPCSDAWVERVAQVADRVGPRFVASISSPETLARLVDKWHLAEELKALGLPHPRTVSVDASQELFTGAFIKPRDSLNFFARFGVKAFRVSSRAELDDALRRVAEAGLEVQLQEYVPGPPTSHYFVDGFIDRKGTLAGAQARRRLRMYPPDFGNSTSFEGVPLADVAPAVDTVTRLLSHLHYRGVFSAEFKRDARDGVFRLIEVNTRPWWYVEFAGRGGMDVTAMAVHDALGEPVTPSLGTGVGRHSAYPYYDYFACREGLRTGTLTWRDWLASWLTSEQPVFRWSDPWPALSATAAILTGRLKRLVTR